MATAVRQTGARTVKPQAIDAAVMAEDLNFHPPDEVRVFCVPDEAIRVWNDQCLLYDVLVQEKVLRHFSFYDRWFEINCTMNRNGTFVVERGPSTVYLETGHIAKRTRVQERPIRLGHLHE